MGNGAVEQQRDIDDKCDECVNWDANRCDTNEPFREGCIRLNHIFFVKIYKPSRIRNFFEHLWLCILGLFIALCIIGILGEKL